jgi:hypothetical protein
VDQAGVICRSRDLDPVISRRTRPAELGGRARLCAGGVGLGIERGARLRGRPASQGGTGRPQFLSALRCSD